MLNTSTITEQVASHLREALSQGRWKGLMPGRDRLIAELGANGRTIEKALGMLEQEGLLKSQGAGRRRRIMASQKDAPAMRVTLILYERDDALNRYISELRRKLQASGHELLFAPKSLAELKHDPERVARMVSENPSGAWIIQSGSRPVLEWFAKSSIPCFSLFGRMQGLDIAGTGPDKLPALREAIQSLADKGHRRFVFLTREERRKPSLGMVERVFLDELEKRGISTGPYNLPDWMETGEGLRDCLDSLFHVSPPSALLIDDWILLLAVQNFIAREKTSAMKQVALICTDFHPSFNWCSPGIAHIHWDHKPMVRRIVRWTGNIARGKDDRKQGLTVAKFIGG
ncbi:GntR family transcriptional regulator [Akkermansiaceae bacterium]|nr:GntR family transcriptional regulator [Akkermansiaceae bacterium]